MKPLNFSLLGIALALSACEPASMYYRPGVSVARMQSDTTDCEVQALRDAPVANQVRQYPPIYVPGDLVCNAAGQCWRGPGYWMGGGFSTVDVNADLRGRVMQQCMDRRGYQPVTLPDCGPSVKTAALARQTTTLPKLTETSCIIRYDGGSWQVVNPVPG